MAVRIDTDRILDLSHLAFLTNLTTLNLGRNRISDSFVSGRLNKTNAADTFWEQYIGPFASGGLDKPNTLGA